MEALIRIFLTVPAPCDRVPHCIPSPPNHYPTTPVPPPQTPVDTPAKTPPHPHQIRAKFPPPSPSTPKDAPRRSGQCARADHYGLMPLPVWQKIPVVALPLAPPIDILPNSSGSDH